MAKKKTDEGPKTRATFAQAHRKLKTAATKAGTPQVFFGGPLERIPTRFLRVNRVLGGGLPVGRAMELFGWEEGYKSTFALYLMADVVAATGKRVIYLDHEHRFVEAYPKSLGLLDAIKWPLDEWVYQPLHFEQGTEMCLRLLETGEVGIVVLDSIAALHTMDEVERGMEDTNMAYKARKMAQFLPKLIPILSATGAIFIGVNQLRQKPGVTFGDPEYTPGGKTMKFHSSIRLRLGKAKVKDKPGEFKIAVGFKKNSVTGFHPKIVYDAQEQHGFDLTTEVLDLALDAGVVTIEEGKGYVFPGGKHCFKLKAKAAAAAEKVRDKIVELAAAVPLS